MDKTVVDVTILGAGIVGVSVALNLRERGLSVALIDRAGVAAGASAGNAGLIERSAVFPIGFPRRLRDLARFITNRSSEVHFHIGKLVRLSPWLFRYWMNSSPLGLRRAGAALLPLVESSLDEHQRLMALAGLRDDLRPQGWIDIFRNRVAFNEASRHAMASAAEFGIKYRLLDGPLLRSEWPGLRRTLAGGIQWLDSASVGDPRRIVEGYAALASQLGVIQRKGDARSLIQTGGRWSVTTSEGSVSSTHAVVAAGIWSKDILSQLGYRIPLESKRGYHVHFTGNSTVLRRPLIDVERGYVLTPSPRGIKLTTGVEFADTTSKATPVQLDRAERSARELASLGDRIEPVAWMGHRPCLPDMLPVIGPAPHHNGLWCAFGHAHHGFTLGPITGRLIADAIVTPRAIDNIKNFSMERFVH